jgi:hypothetical protein
MSENTRVTDPYPWRWKKGTTGNAGGKPKFEARVRETAQHYSVPAIHRLAQLAGLLVDEQGRPIKGARTDAAQINALNSLLDRAVGKARQDLTVEGDGSSAIALHLLAATAVSREIIERMERRNTIEHAEPANGRTGPAPADLLSAPLPTE